MIEKVLPYLSTVSVLVGLGAVFWRASAQHARLTEQVRDLMVEVAALRSKAEAAALAAGETSVTLAKVTTTLDGTNGLTTQVVRMDGALGAIQQEVSRIAGRLNGHGARATD